MASWQDIRTRTPPSDQPLPGESPCGCVGKDRPVSNKVTLLGLLVSGATAYWISAGNFLGGGILLLVAALMDMADGALARRFGTASPRGRAPGLHNRPRRRGGGLVGAAGLLPGPAFDTEALLINLALVGSFMVSYLRARGEGLGIDCKVGIMTRPERVLVLAAAFFWIRSQ